MRDFAMSEPTPHVLPFIKWAGGKRWASDLVSKILAGQDRPYVEPFLGSGAVFFSLKPKVAMLSDINGELVNTFTCVKSNPQQLIDGLSSLSIDRETYMALRATVPEDELSRAIRFIYLNKTAFNGLYRVNRKGNFNVPFGCKPSTRLCDKQALNSCSALLKNASLSNKDYGAALQFSPHGSHIYVDPPYATSSTTTFLRYHQTLFDWQDQVRLAALLHERSKQGCQIVVSNAMDPAILSLYRQQDFFALKLSRPSNMASNPLARGRRDELLIISRTLHRRLTQASVQSALAPFDPQILKLSGRNQK